MLIASLFCFFNGEAIIMPILKIILLMNMVLIAMYSENLLAKSSDKDELEVSLRIKNFEYQEFSSNNQLLNKESGPIVGLGMIYYEQYGDVLMQLQAALYDGVVDYKGQTQGGSPITSRSDTTIGELDFFVTRWLNRQDTWRYGIYAGLGFYYWERNIRSTTTASGSPVAGLFEKYMIGYGSLGVKIKYLSGDQSSGSLDVRASKIFSADIDVDFQGAGGFDNATLDLGKKYGFRIGLPWEKKLSQNSSLIINPYYEFWKFGVSNTRQLTINGAPSGTSIFEPESETGSFGLNIGFRQLF